MNPDLAKERGNVTFDPHFMSCYLYGSSKKLHRKKYLENLVDIDPEFNYTPRCFLSHEEKYDQGYELEVKTVRKCRQLNLTDENDIAMFHREVMPTSGSPTTLHFLAFVPPILSQGSEEQIKKWLPRIQAYEVLGSYSQTELAHGSNVRGIETTAVYDPKTQEFVLSTPSLNSIKWWPGNLARSSNHTLLMAQLYTQGKCYGVFPFIVQLRDIETHQLLPGVETGCIGPNLGDAGVDNGYLKLNNVRIPRENMLMRYSQVLPDGTFCAPPSDKLAYGGMLAIRAQIPSGVAYGLSKVATIATRYSLVRRQSELAPGDPEPQVLDYQTQQLKVLPAIALSYVFWFMARWLKQKFIDLQKDMKEGKYDSLLGMHIAASGLKAFSTSQAARTCEECRLACGGHGYSEASGIPAVYRSMLGTVTAEGEATVLYLQTGKGLLKAYMTAKKGGKLDDTMAYLQQANTVQLSVDNAQSIRRLVVAFESRARWVLEECASRVQVLLSQGQSMPIAVNNSSVLLVQAAEAHSELLTLKCFIPEIDVAPKELQQALEPLAVIYALHRLLQNSGYFVQANCVKSSDLQSMRRVLYNVLSAVRPNAIAYVDAFGHNDRQLESVLGRYDGNVYQELYKWAQQSPLNKSQVHQSFNKYLKPFRTGSHL